MVLQRSFDGDRNQRRHRRADLLRAAVSLPRGPSAFLDGDRNQMRQHNGASSKRRADLLRAAVSLCRLKEIGPSECLSTYSHFKPTVAPSTLRRHLMKAVGSDEFNRHHTLRTRGQDKRSFEPEVETFNCTKVARKIGMASASTTGIIDRDYLIKNIQPSTLLAASDRLLQEMCCGLHMSYPKEDGTEYRRLNVIAQLRDRFWSGHEEIQYYSLQKVRDCNMILHANTMREIFGDPGPQVEDSS